MVNKKIVISMGQLVILGGGESGIGAALLAKTYGLAVFLSDAGTIAPIYKKELIQYNIPFEEGEHTIAKILTASEVIKSPGIPYSVPVVQQVKAANIPIVDEIEFAARYAQGFIIAITGSNGKTTTTHLIHHLLASSGYSATMVGNMGRSFARSLLIEKYDYYVVELSSFQLEGLSEFKADIECDSLPTPN